MNINLPETAVDLLLNIINIIVLFIVVKALVYKPVKRFLDERSDRIAKETGAANELVEKANETLKIKDEILEEAKKKGEDLADKAYKEAKQSADSIIEDAKKKAKSIEDKAEEKAKAEKDKLLASSKDEIANLSITIAEKILKRETNQEDNQKILDEFFGNEG